MNSFREEVRKRGEAKFAADQQAREEAAELERVRRQHDLDEFIDQVKAALGTEIWDDLNKGRIKADFDCSRPRLLVELEDGLQVELIRNLNPPTVSMRLLGSFESHGVQVPSNGSTYPQLAPMLTARLEQFYGGGYEQFCHDRDWRIEMERLRKARVDSEGAAKKLVDEFVIDAASKIDIWPDAPGWALDYYQIVRRFRDGGTQSHFSVSPSRDSAGFWNFLDLDYPVKVFDVFEVRKLRADRLEDLPAVLVRPAKQTLRGVGRHWGDGELDRSRGGEDDPPKYHVASDVEIGQMREEVELTVGILPVEKLANYLVSQASKTKCCAWCLKPIQGSDMVIQSQPEWEPQGTYHHSCSPWRAPGVQRPERGKAD